LRELIQGGIVKKIFLINVAQISLATLALSLVLCLSLISGLIPSIVTRCVSEREAGIRCIPRLRFGLLFLQLTLFFSCNAALGQGFAEESLSADQLEFFEAKIRPVLVEHCYECHNSADSAEGELTLDFRQGVLEGGANGPIVVPGKPEESSLLAILRHEVEGLEMPEDGAKLEDHIIADFEKWIAMGLPDPRDVPPSAEDLSASTSWEATLERRKQWWSFLPIQQPEIPAVEGVNHSDHPVDRFIAEKLAAEALQASSQAEPAVLVRRLYFNLIGLPPSVEEAREWTAKIAEANESERTTVIETLIDQLLDSPRFGERWARHWMDWIRYAESHGSEGDPEIHNAWIYRDYLIRALNSDVGYDQLVREHVAGDLLESPRVNHELGINESMIGPVHWRMVFHGFAPTDPLDEKVRFVDDQINVFSKAFLGLTVSCARCHNHKFDAISQKDYYALFGILGSCRPGRVVIDLPEKQIEHRETLAALKPKIRASIAEDWLAALGYLPGRLAADDGPWKQADKREFVLQPLRLVRQEIAAGKDFDAAWKNRVREQQENLKKWENFRSSKPVKLWDFSNVKDYSTWYANGSGLPERPQLAGEFSIAATGEAALTGIYPAGVYSHSLSAKYPARLTSADFTSGENQEVWLRVIGEQGATVRYVMQDYPRNGTVYPVPGLGNRWRWQRLDLAYWNNERLHLELTSAKDAPLLVKGQARSWFGIREAIIIAKGQNAPIDQDEHLAPLFELAKVAEIHSVEDLAELYRKTIASAVEAWRTENVSDAQAALLNACLRQGLLPNELSSLNTAASLVEEYRRVENEVLIPTRVPGLEETVGTDQRLFERGNHKLPGAVVPRRFLEAIDRTPYKSKLSGRLELAEDLLRDDNPLSRRVIVNRIWHHLFGRGLVGTPNNFGRLGEKPTHPELLDWLASRFVEDGWSLKKAIRLLVTSQVWQLSADADENSMEQDPDNRLVSHASVRRLEAESIRDSLLNSAGTLEHRLYGSPVSNDSPRRSVYVRVVRNSLVPLLRVFDAPEPFASTGRRDVTNVPAQSLTLMNDPVVTRYAAYWGARVVGDPELTTDEKRIEQMFATAFSRSATAAELGEVQTYLAEARSRYQKLTREHAGLLEELASQEAARVELIRPVRERLVAELKSKRKISPTEAPKPISCWEFEEGFGDSVGSLQPEKLSQVSVEGGALIVDGQAHFTTVPLEQTLKEKTLEAWVQLGNLEQRGGGVMSVQSLDGEFFDAIVFGEKTPDQWLAGSNSFARTKPFAGPKETEAVGRPVQIVIAYHADGKVVGYRDGKPYGKAYQSNGPYKFEAGKAMVGFGVRHLPAVGNRLLKGKILQAKLYGKALSADEVGASFQSAPWGVSESEVLTAMEDRQRQAFEQLGNKISLLKSSIEALGSVPETVDEKTVWSDLALALFSFKEFIYVR